MALSFMENIKKYNKWHDPKTGRFTSAPGGASSKYSTADMDKLKSLIESGATFSAIKQRKAMGMSEEEYKEIKDGIKPPKQVEQKPKKERPEGLVNAPTKQEKPTEDDYRMRHRPNKMGSGHDITDAGMMPKDFYDHPEWYAAMHEQSYKESMRALRTIRNKPDAEVTIYRAAPVNEFNDGDWVTLSRTYAKTHAEHVSSENNQLQVYSKKVKAKDIQFAGDDINEFGYFPVDGVSKSFFAVVEKYNPYHDKLGRFTTAGNASASSVWSSKVKEERSRVLSMKDNEQAMYLLDNYGVDERGQMPELYESILEAFNSDQIGKMVNNYFTIMEANGDPTPTKATSGQKDAQLRKDVESGKYDGSWDKARTSYMKEDTGLSDDDIANAKFNLERYFAGSTLSDNNGTKKIPSSAETVEKYIAHAPAYDGRMYRGMRFYNATDHDAFMANVSPGATIAMNGISSWTSGRETARVFSHMIDDNISSIEITCVKNRTSTPVAHISTLGEDEVLASGKARWTVLHSETFTNSHGQKKTQILVVEKGE